MIRAVQTATIIKDLIGFSGDMIVDDLLIERQQGKMTTIHKQSKLYKEINQFKFNYKSKDPIENQLNESLLQDMVNEKFNIDKESYQALSDRSMLFVDKLVASKYKKILVISHCSLLTCMLKSIFRIPNINYANNCFISYMTYDEHSTNTNKFTLITAPNTDHLKMI